MFTDELYRFELSQAVLPTLACGGELKSSVCLATGKDAWLTPPMGDLADFATFMRYQNTIAELKKFLKITPEIIAHDLHPDYASTRYALAQSNAKKIAVQHHHAHIASCMAEHKINRPVIGICWDGAGWGTDGNLWGGEFLLADYKGFTRKAHLAYIPLPGGAAAIKEPYRVALSLLHSCFNDKLTSLKLDVLKYIGNLKLNILLKMINQGLNCPQSSGMGRLFDGVASIIRLCDINTFEAEAAIELERIARKSSDDGTYPYKLAQEENTHIIDYRPLVREIATEYNFKQTKAIISRRFHNTLVDIALKICLLITEDTKTKQVVLCGGVFQNKLLTKLLVPQLKSTGFEVFLPKRISPNDSSIALGQILIANAGT
jgi:hydrogenase maturation protein HypF